MIVLRSDSGETHVRRHATWGMYVETPGHISVAINTQLACNGYRAILVHSRISPYSFFVEFERGATLPFCVYKIELVNYKYKDHY